MFSGNASSASINILKFFVIWGNSEGGRMFSDITAFGKERWDVINHNDIIVFLRVVYDRWIEEIDYETGEI
jgi:hypothetical protein